MNMLVAKKIILGGVTMDTMLVENAKKIIAVYDRMPENPDNRFLSISIKAQLEETGILKFVVLVCPKFDTLAIFSDKPENYIPLKATSNDLFEPRIPKILELRDNLFRVGVVTTIDVVIGDNDFETYILPYLPNVKWDKEKAKVRKGMYLESYKGRITNAFGVLSNVWSLSDMGITLSEKTPSIDTSQLTKEVNFLQQLFSKEGPYKGSIPLDQALLEKIAIKKFNAYGTQGEFLEELGGILLQTEGPGVWLQRTQMYRCTGAKAIPTIYPWIRRDEIIANKNNV